MKGKKSKKLTPRQFALTIAELVYDKKGEDIVILDVRKVSTICDYFVLASCESDVQIETISEHIIYTMKKKGYRVVGTEGLEYKRWVVLDYGFVIVHLMLKELRDFYSLEKIWSEAKKINYKPKK